MRIITHPAYVADATIKQPPKRIATIANALHTLAKVRAP